jgi:hypothetical protein
MWHLIHIGTNKFAQRKKITIIKDFYKKKKWKITAVEEQL